MISSADILLMIGVKAGPALKTRICYVGSVIPTVFAHLSTLYRSYSCRLSCLLVVMVTLQR